MNIPTFGPGVRRMTMEDFAGRRRWYRKKICAELAAAVSPEALELLSPAQCARIFSRVIRRNSRG